MKKISTLILLSIISSWSLAADLNSFTKNSDAFLSKYVKNGRVAYSAIKQNHGAVSNLYESIENMNLDGTSDNQKKTFYINAYNIIVIYYVTKFYPLQSPLDQSGFFNKVKHKVAGESMSLNGLEIKKLLIPYKDPRIHFALACAAVSCPPLASFAYTPDLLDQQLETRTKLSINDSDWLKVNSKENKVFVSKIFDWYEKDFTSTGDTVLEFINKFKAKKIPDNYKVDFYNYNWKLNDE